jgi:anaphase-promoting complex subunit 5
MNSPSDDKVAVEHIIAQLQAVQLLEFEMRLQLAFHTIEFTIRQGDYGRALRMVEQAAHSMQPENFDVHSQIKLLCLKARILEKSGHPQRGFSLAMRAASIAHRSKILLDLWESICTLTAVLLSLREFEAGAELVESIMPQVLESEDFALIARAYSLLVDANMGIAGELWATVGKESAPVRKEYVNRAIGYIDSAYDSYEEIEDLLGQTEMMAKKATVMHLTGDPVLANDYAAKYLDLRRRRGAEI